MLLLLLACTSLPIPGLNNSPSAAPPPAAPVAPMAAPAAAPPPQAAAPDAAASVPVAVPVATTPVANTSVPVSPPGAPVVPAAITPAMLTAQTLYGACRERVEQPESAGECGIDSDCVAVGCSKEVCVSNRIANEIATSCTTQPCFPYLDHCGCHAGLCEWSLKIPEGQLKTLPGLGAPPAGAQ